MLYIEAVGFTMMGASVTIFTTLYFERQLTQLSKRLLGVIRGPKPDRKPKFQPKLRKLLRFYQRYGFWGLMTLTPILIGLPVGTWIAVRLGSSRPRVAVTALLMSLFWSTLSYWVTFNGVEQLTS